MLLEVSSQLENELVKPRDPPTHIPQRADFKHYLDDPIKEAQKARDYWNSIDSRELDFVSLGNK